MLTGASRGIGHATVKKFSTAGWRVLTCSRQIFDERCPWPGGQENHIQVDLANPKSTMAATEEIKNKLNGKLHALINNAGASPKSTNGTRMNTLDTDLELWHTVFQSNFFAPILLAKALKNELAAAKGAVVNVTSIAGSRVHPFAGSAYATSKAALATLTREMAHDFRSPWCESKCHCSRGGRNRYFERGHRPNHCWTTPAPYWATKRSSKCNLFSMFRKF